MVRLIKVDGSQKVDTGDVHGRNNGCSSAWVKIGGEKEVGISRHLQVVAGEEIPELHVGRAGVIEEVETRVHRKRRLHLKATHGDG